MTVKSIPYWDKRLIAGWFRDNIYNQTELAKKFQTSNRTINRVLLEMGAAPAIMPRIDERIQSFMLIIDQYGLDPDGLAKALSAPALIHSNVQEYLNQCTTGQLASLFYQSGLAKIIESVRKKESPPLQIAEETPHAETTH